MPSRTPSPPYRVKTKPGYPPLAEAAAIALAVMRAAGVGRWVELGERLPDVLELTDRQHQLLADHADVLGFLRLGRRSDDDTRSATVTVGVCATCGEWVLVSSGPAPTRCEMTRGCPGKQVKAAIATKDAGELRQAA